MPEPDRHRADLTQLTRDTVTLQRAALHPVEIEAEIPDVPVFADVDGTLLGQAFTNLVKNAGEAIESRGSGEFERKIRIVMSVTDGFAELRIVDTGVGLPADRARLFEPYVTTREKGTGLGLPIVKKIVEEHGGTLELRDAPAGADGHKGAEAVLRLPLIEEVHGI